MGVFFKALAAIVTADAIDRHARARPTRYWYPSHPGLPRPVSEMPYLTVAQAPAAPPGQAPPAAWDHKHPERPRREPNYR